jgi:hypothetical protein
MRFETFMKTHDNHNVSTQLPCIHHSASTAAYRPIARQRP